MNSAINKSITDNLFGLQPPKTLLIALENDDPALESMTLDQRHLSEEEITQLCTGIKTNTCLQSLSMIDCALSQPQLREICKAIKENNHLKEIRLEKFKDYPSDLTELINETIKHVEQNEHDSAASPSMRKT